MAETASVKVVMSAAAVAAAAPLGATSVAASLTLAAVDLVVVQDSAGQPAAAAYQHARCAQDAGLGPGTRLDVFGAPRSQTVIDDLRTTT